MELLVKSLHIDLMNNNLDRVIQKRAPFIFKKNIIGKIFRLILKKLFKYEETKKNLEVINAMKSQEALKWLSDKYTPNVVISGQENIPKEKSALIVANHPMGPADVISLNSNLNDVRNDIYIYANEIFIDLVGEFKDCMVPLYWDKNKEIHIANKTTYKKMIAFIKKEMIGIYFPSGRIAKYGVLKTKDYIWHETPLNIAKRYDLKIIPIYIDSRNSIIFYLSRLLHNNLRDISQIYELLNKKNRHIKISIGPPINRKDLNKKNSIAIKELRKIVENLR